MQSRLREEFELLGDLGQGSDGGPVWLGRARQTGQLVALALPAVATTADTPDFTVLPDLGPGVPAGERKCHVCSSMVRDWRRYCGQCGSDLSGTGLDSRGDLQPAELNTLLGEASRQNLDVLGQMKRADGGGAVYFARERDTREIFALNLRRAPAGHGSGTLERTGFTGSRGTGAAARPVAITAAGSVAALDPPVTGSERICPACGRMFSGEIRFCSHDGTALRSAEKDVGLIGQVIAERYLVLDKIGQGGMGEVYLAEHVKMGRRCALKVLHRSAADTIGMIGRFAREAASASRITHPNVATIYDFGETSDRLIYLAMEYVDGEPLSTLIRREGRLGAEPARLIAAEIAAGLAAAHRQGVIHRDLKPDNVLVGRGAEGQRVVKVVDFGIAKALNAAASDLTQTGFVVGTPQYMSPEQLIAEAVDFRSDIYALGCVLFEMLTGTPPFGDSDGTLRLTRRLTEAPPDARAAHAAVPDSLAEIAMRALARLPADRFQHATELRDALLAADVEPRTSPVTARVPAAQHDPAATVIARAPGAPAAAAAPGFATRSLAALRGATDRVAAVIAGLRPAPRHLPRARLPGVRLPRPRLPALRLPTPRVPVLFWGAAGLVLILVGAGVSISLLTRGAPADAIETTPLQPTTPSAAAAVPDATVLEAAPVADSAVPPAAAETPRPTAAQAAAGETAPRGEARPVPVAPTSPAAAVVTPPRAAGTPPLGTPQPQPPSLQAHAGAELDRFAAALASRDMDAARQALTNPAAMTPSIEAELLNAVTQRTQPRVTAAVREIGGADGLLVSFRIQIVDAAAATPPFTEDYSARYRRDAGGGWALMAIRKLFQ